MTEAKKAPALCQEFAKRTKALYNNRQIVIDLHFYPIESLSAKADVGKICLDENVVSPKWKNPPVPQYVSDPFLSTATFFFFLLKVTL